MLVVILYSNIILADEYILETNDHNFTSSQDNTPELHAISDWGGLGSTSACQVIDSADAADGESSTLATFQMSDNSGDCYLGINLQYNYKVIDGNMIKPSYFDIEIEYSQSLPMEENCAWFSVLAVNGHTNPAQGTVIERYNKDQNGNYYWIGNSSCNGGPGDPRAPLPSSPITTDMRDDNSHMNGYNNSNDSGFTVEIIVNPWYEPQFNMYIREVRIIPSSTCYNDTDCDGISDNSDSIDYTIDWHPDAKSWGGNLDPALKIIGPPGIGLIAPPCADDHVNCNTNTAVTVTMENRAKYMNLQFGLGKGGGYEDQPSNILSYFYVENLTSGGWDEVYTQTGLRTSGTWENITLWSDHYSDNNVINISFRVNNQQTGQVGSVTGSWTTLIFYEVMNLDSDGDGFEDTEDVFPMNPLEWIDTDGDGIGNNGDDDDDDDGWLDTDEIQCLTDPLDSMSFPDDFDGDMICDLDDDDDDGDGVDDLNDEFPNNELEWLDTDNDGIGNNEDSDDDGDGWYDFEEYECYTDSLDYQSIPDDFDILYENWLFYVQELQTWECDYVDSDDDNDGILDFQDPCPFSDWFSYNTETLEAIYLDYDTDGDGCFNLEDNDDDGDGTMDLDDDFPMDSSEQMDLDSDGLGDNADLDDDADGWLDDEETNCANAGGKGDPKNANIQPIDNETNIGADGLYGTDDDFVIGDGICNSIDQDDDNDGYNDDEDMFIWDPTEWFDYDLDGIGDNYDKDDDNDNWSDEKEIECQTNSLSEMSIPRDTDNDGECDYIDTDDDGDGVNDTDDLCPESIDGENIDSLGCKKQEMGIFETLSDTLFGQIISPQEWSMLVLGIVFIIATMRFRQKNEDLEIKDRLGLIEGDDSVWDTEPSDNTPVQKTISTKNEEINASSWTVLQSMRLREDTPHGRDFETDLRKYRDDFILKGNIDATRERGLFSQILRHAALVEVDIRGKNAPNWKDDDLMQESCTTILRKVDENRKNKGKIYIEWGWKDKGIILYPGLMKELDQAVHPDLKHRANLGKAKKWKKSDSEKVSDLITELINGLQL